MSSDVSEWLPAALTAIDPALVPLAVVSPADGIANEVLLVETTAGPVVVKRYRDQRSARREMTANALMAAHGIPAPAVVGAMARAGGMVVVFARLPGVSWNRALAELSEPEIERAYAAFGTLVARIHGVVGSEHGELSGGEVGLSWREVHRAEVAARLDQMRGTVLADLVPEVEEFMDEYDFLLDGPVVPRLLHMDLHGGNLLVHVGEISGVLDAEEALFGHHEYDLMRLDLAHFRGVPSGRKAAFLASYTAVIPLDAGAADRARVYEVSRGTAWAVSVLRNRGSADSVEQVRAEMLALVDG